MRTESQPMRPSELDTYLAALRAATARVRLRERGRERQSAEEPARFVTISRQAGAGGRSLGRRRVERTQHCTGPARRNGPRDSNAGRAVEC
jgi:hypothetical protein